LIAPEMSAVQQARARHIYHNSITAFKVTKTVLRAARNELTVLAERRDGRILVVRN